jgi:hypothetical protein
MTLCIMPVLNLRVERGTPSTSNVSLSKHSLIVIPRVHSRASCEPADPTNNVSERLNQLLSSGGAGYTLSLCPNQNYPITAALQFTAPDQEISTQGLPTDSSRAMLTITGPVMQSNQPNHTTAVQGQCPTCNGVRLRHIQVLSHIFIAPA